ncbi:MAG: MerR family transcriptional regulator [Crocosphaera sp.]|nr:MerR family transcriptional regulator [Crocosphaera sp.]
MHYRPSEFADLAGVSVKTLHRWDSSGKLKPLRTVGGHRYYTDEHINHISVIVSFGKSCDGSRDEFLSIASDESTQKIQILKKIEEIASDGNTLYLGFRGPVLRENYVPIMVKRNLKI